MKLITKRMTVMSLTPEQMMLCARNVQELEKELTLAYYAEPIEGEFREVLKRQSRLCEDDENNYLWHTFWMFHLDREMIGTAYFGGLPGGEGDVSIAFCIGNDFMNQGYTTEAVSKLVDWAFRQDGVKNVVAETEKENRAAQRVLEKCGFEKYRATENTYCWVMSMAMLAKKKAADAAPPFGRK